MAPKHRRGRISRGTPKPTNETEQAWFQAHIDQTKQSCLMSRYGTLDEMAAPILFLASDDASYITGSVLPSRRWRPRLAACRKTLEVKRHNSN
ncbi:SDR family oxidoreductase [Halomonas sp. HL-93]|uniref:SDR family oxidoreductase n=1 Tax=Halomonas sp. HL-93 TaxID=1666906 RepID=UPI0022B234E6|nr:SDR family oxidoreductase [Halomonas sp. HL-93]